MKKSIMLPLLALIISLPVDAALYRWVDASGKVHYGDKIPPTVAQNGHTKLNKNGTAKEQVDSAEKRKLKSIELKKEKARKEALKEAREIEALRDLRDKQLLSMFSNVGELKTVYNNKIALADDSISVLKSRHEKLSAKLEEYEARHERMVNPVDKRKLGIKVEEILFNLNIYQQAITDNLIERRDLQERFKNELARYVELTPQK